LAEFVKGEVVVVPFPFSDLSETKKRPAFVVTSFEDDDLILCQITSKTIKDDYSISITEDAFEYGSLNQPSNIRPNRIFTADKQLILYKIGKLKVEEIFKVVERIIEIIRK
jgi:mRNA interferase MazF